MKHNTSLIGPQIRCEKVPNFLTVSMTAYSKGSNIPRTQITNGVGNKK